ncbi:unnamed protein product [Penicillium olsonii]|uniref:Uncharacterized protein n=1 Tax=Penicillium olsonii TaxID=99116 RepID=A0A9W4HH07_PENOL|nr:unnamed protein product [Penicillium olsonii]
MLPVLPHPLTAGSAHPFSLPASLGSCASTINSKLDSWSRHSNMAQHPMYGPQAASPIVYHQRSPSTPHGYGYGEDRQAHLGPMDYDPQARYGAPVPLDARNHMMSPSMGRLSYPPAGQPVQPPRTHDWSHPAHLPRDALRRDLGVMNPENPEYVMERNSRRAAEKPRGNTHYHSQRRTSNRDEFDGPHQFLEPPSAQAVAAQDKELPQLPTNLDASEQDNILHKVNDRLSQCAYDFIAKYQFRVPIEQDKRPVKVPSDREWTEWVHLLKRLATTRRIPAHLLYNRQIKQLITVLENSLEMRHAAKHQSRPVKDDRNVLQLISAGIQVAKILKDASAMQFLDCLYVDTEKLILERRGRRVRFANP